MDRLGRRRFLRRSLALAGVGLLAGCGLWTPRGPDAAPAGRVPRIGVLGGGSPGEGATPGQREALLAGLRELGYVEGRSIAIEYRHAEGQLGRLPDLAAELVALPVELIVAGGDTSASEVRRVSQTIPIVSVPSSAPVEIGMAASLARPGGNYTGFSDASAELAPKRLEVLRETIPGLARVGVLWPPDLPGPSLQFRETEAAARTMGVTIVPLEMRTADDLEAAYEAAARSGAEALVVVPSAPTNIASGRIVGLTARVRLPAVYGDRRFVDAGGLMSYGPDILGMWRRAAGYVDKILKGADAGDLPIERPARLDFILNLKAAEALGLAIPPSVLQQATEIIR